MLGAFFAEGQSSLFDWKFWLCLIGASLAHLGANSANDYFDWIRGTDKISWESIPELRQEQISGSNVLAEKLMTTKQAFTSVVMFFSLAFICGIVLFVQIGWPILLFAFIGFSLGFFYCSPKIGFGYVGRGLGELGIFFAFGALPVVGTYYVLGGQNILESFLSSIPLGLIAVMILFHHHFSHIETDAKSGKNSPPVILGRKNAKILAYALIIFSIISILALIAEGIYPTISLISIIPLLVLIFLPWENNLSGDILRMKHVSALSLSAGFLLALLVLF